MPSDRLRINFKYRMRNYSLKKFEALFFFFRRPCVRRCRVLLVFLVLFFVFTFLIDLAARDESQKTSIFSTDSIGSSLLHVDQLQRHGMQGEKLLHKNSAPFTIEAR